jgi:nitroreductase
MAERDQRSKVLRITAIGPAALGPSAAAAGGDRPYRSDMTEASSTDNHPTPILASQASYLIGIAGRAPSLHNTQPWHFTVSDDAVELYADDRRRLRADQGGRELVISCGAALYGLRLAVRSLGYLPAVELLPGPPGHRPLARVRLGPPVRPTADERKMIAAVPHRHTHRGPFEPGPLPPGLFATMRDDARAEDAALTRLDPGSARDELMALLAASATSQDRDPRTRAEIWLWSRGPASPERDGVPAHAFPAVPGRAPGQLPQRDFDLGRGVGLLAGGGPAAAVIAVLSTPADGELDWLHAGQALHRLLLHAASRWVFASLNTQPLEEPATRAQIRARLVRPEWPQMLLAFGVSRTAHPTPRRPAADLTGP